MLLFKMQTNIPNPKSNVFMLDEEANMSATVTEMPYV